MLPANCKDTRRSFAYVPAPLPTRVEADTVLGALESMRGAVRAYWTCVDTHLTEENRGLARMLFQVGS